MTTPQRPSDLFTEKDLEVASILLEVHDLALKYDQQVPFEEVRWGRRRRRTEPPYQFKPQLERDESGCRTSSDEEKKKEVEEEEKRASPATPLCFPNSSSEEQIITPSVLKQIKKPSSHNDRLKEKREQVAVLTKEKADLSREFVELQGKFQMLCAMKLYLRDQNSKLLAQAEMRALNHIVQQPVGSTQTSKQQLAPLPPTERRRWEINLNEQPTDDVGSAYAVEGPLTCQYDREEKAARSAEARKRRMEKQRERRSSSSAHKRPRVS